LITICWNCIKTKLKNNEKLKEKNVVGLVLIMRKNNQKVLKINKLFHCILIQTCIGDTRLWSKNTSNKQIDWFSSTKQKHLS
jgi:hypothetical protein